MNEFPLVLAGPIVRRCEPDLVCIWLALKSQCDVELSVFDDPDRDPILTGEHSTIRLGESLHVVSVTARDPTAPLAWGESYWYGLRFRDGGTWRDLYDDGVLRHGIADADPLDRLVYEGEPLPSFRLPPQELERTRLAHGSCRKPHGPGRDGLATLDGELVKAFASGARQTVHQQLFLTGDQIYADDVAPDLLKALIDAGARIIGPDQEKARELQAFEDRLEPGQRLELLSREAHLTSKEASSHLVTLSEFYMMYLFAFSDVLWPSEGLAAPLPHFRASLPHVRRALANVATYMIFDDHEVTDDWNRRASWVRDVTGSDLGARIVRNGLVAYGLFQHWGNDPATFEDGTPGSGFLTAVDGWDGTRAGAAAVLEYVHVPSGTGELEPVPEGAVSWHYSLDTPNYRMVALDIRTRRTFKSDDAQPGLMSNAALDASFPASAPERPFTLVLSATPVLGLGLIEFVQSNVGKLVDFVRGGASGSDAFDVEAWAFDEDAYGELLRRLSERRRVLVLSGDVHYGFGATLRAKDFDFRLVNFVSSSLRNQVFAETAAAFLNAFGGSWRDLEAVGTPHLHDAPSPEVVLGERKVGAQMFEEEVLGEAEEGLEGVESTAGLSASTRLRGILGSANVGDIRFLGKKVEQRLFWWTDDGELQVKRHEATLDVPGPGSGFEGSD